MARPVQAHIEDLLVCSTFSDLESLIETAKDARGQLVQGRRPTSEQEIAMFLVEELVEVRGRAERLIARLAAKDAGADAASEAEDAAAEAEAA